MSDPIQQHYVERTHDAAQRFQFVPKYAADCALFALPLALGIAFVEVCMAGQDPHWLGGTPGQWRETLFTVAVYWSVIALASFLFAGIIRLSTGRDRIDRWIVSLISLPVALGVYAGLKALGGAGETTALDIGYFAGVFVFVGGILALATARVVPPRWFAVQVSAAVLGGIAAIRYAAILWALEDVRTLLAPTHGVIWLVVVTIAIAFGNLMFRRLNAPFKLTLGLSATAFMLPLAFYSVPRLYTEVFPSDAPNFLFISADTMRADQSSVYGGPVSTPALEALAQDGVVADRFYATAPWTVPSLCSLFSGRFPVSLTPGLTTEERTAEETSQHRLYAYWRGASGPTLVGGMRAKGYQTIAVVANPATNAHHWLWQDFDRYQLIDGAAWGPYGRFAQSPLFRDAAARWIDGLVEKRPVDSTAQVVHYARMLLKAHTRQPFFLWVHFMDPHSPYDPPPESRVTHERWSMFPPTPEEQQAEPDWPFDMTDSEKQYALDQYRAEIAYIDSSVGSILDALEAKADSTYVSFFSDHGEEFWEHGRWGHGQTLFEEQVRVPFILAGPRVGQGRITTALSAIDFAPTIADLLDLYADEGWHGQSQVRAFRDPSEQPPPRPVFAQGTQHAMFQEEPQQMVLDGALKLVRGLDSGAESLYDLDADPAESRDILDERPEDAARLRKMLETWDNSFPSTFEEALGGGKVEPDPETLQRMKDIGYLQD
jgi:arylsulfatase A-like enzyme